MPHQFDRHFKFKINDDTWSFFLITEQEAHELDQKLNDLDEGFRAMTVKEDRSLFVVEGNVTKEIINHELFHIYVSYFYLDSASLSNEEFEEIIAEFLERDMEKFMKKRNIIYRKYKELNSGSKSKEVRSKRHHPPV